MEVLSLDIRRKAEEWLSLDRNETTRSEIFSLITNGNLSELASRLSTRMTFGTAGLRAQMGAGYNRMNDLTVIQTTQGLSKYLEKKFGKEAGRDRGVVVGYDARHNSYRFSQLVATVLVSQGIRVYLFSCVTPTPFTPFAVKKYNCMAGVMVTASHNPKEDNGYKVYWSNGAQIIPPHDKCISSSIIANHIPWKSSWDTSLLAENQLITDPYADIEMSYFSSILKYCFHYENNAVCPVTCVYTAMHGVGYPFVKLAFQKFGLPEIVPVPEQVEPNPDFPTVKYPNPEEGKSALDLAMATADNHGHCLIIANDPDADRLALAEKQLHVGNDSKTVPYWRVFTGNEIGAVLGWWAFENFKKNHPQFDGSKVHIIASVVSSKLLQSLANVEGIQFQQTLTGFKWMGNLSDSLLNKNEEVLFAFEEAIGFMFGTTVLDKDGISAAVVIGELAGYLYSHKRTFSSLLEDIYSKYGRTVSETSYFICNSKKAIEELFDSLRKDKKYPTTCGLAKVIGVSDITVGYDSTRPPDYKSVLPVDPNNQMIMFQLDNHCEFTLRTSGTEPKIKYYVYMSSPPGVNIPEDTMKATLHETVQNIIQDFLRPNQYNLVPR